MVVTCVFVGYLVVALIVNARRFTQVDGHWGHFLAVALCALGLAFVWLSHSTHS